MPTHKPVTCPIHKTQLSRSGMFPEKGWCAKCGVAYSRKEAKAVLTKKRKQAKVSAKNLEQARKKVTHEADPII